MTPVDLSKAAVTARLRQASEATMDLSAERRLDTKIDLTPAGISRRLHEAFELYEFGRSLALTGLETRRQRI